MPDSARGLSVSKKVRDECGDDVFSGERPARVIAIGGGKGGVGKSMVATSVSLLLAEAGRRVTLVDADLGGANIHTILGMRPPTKTLSDFVAHRADLADIIVQSPFEHLAVISGALDDVRAANPKHMQKMRLLRHLTRIDADYLVLDLGAGTSLNTLDFFLLADDAVVCVLPEPTAVENAYRFLKAGFMRRLQMLQGAYDIGDVVEAARLQKNGLGIKTPADLIAYLKREKPQVGADVEAQMARFSPWLILNQIRFAEYRDAQVASDMASACRRFFGIDLRVLGTIPHDDDVRRAIRQRKPLVKTYPKSFATTALVGLVRKLTSEPGIREHAA